MCITSVAHIFQMKKKNPFPSKMLIFKLFEKATEMIREWSFAAMIAFTVRVAIMSNTNATAKSPGSAIWPVIALLLQSILIVISSLDVGLYWKTVFLPIKTNSHSSLAALLYGNVQLKAAVLLWPSQQWRVNEKNKMVTCALGNLSF